MVAKTLFQRAALGAVIGLTLAACGSTPKNDTPSGPSTVRDFGGKKVDKWWDNPKDLPYDLCVVGTAPFMGNLGAARNSAELDARAKLAAMKESKVQQLLEDWSQQTGDMLKPESVTSLLNNEQITRGITDENISGARPIAYQVIEMRGQQQQFVLMTLEDTTLFFENIKMAVEENIIAEETYYKTEVRKEEASARLDDILAADKKKIEERQSVYSSQEQ